MCFYSHPSPFGTGAKTVRHCVGFAACKTEGVANIVTGLGVATKILGAGRFFFCGRGRERCLASAGGDAGPGGSRGRSRSKRLFFKGLPMDPGDRPGTDSDRSGPGIRCPCQMRYSLGPRMDPCSAVIFDMDGVIVDSEPRHERAFREIFAGMGYAETHGIDFPAYYGRSDRALWLDFIRMHRPRSRSRC